MKSENGRSMVEMLGVLAIIGVLSVGAIAGYGKAMFKYKLNKHAEQLTTIINAVAVYGMQIKANPVPAGNSSRISLIPVLNKLNYIPKEMLKATNQDYIYDVFNSQIDLLSGYYNIPGWDIPNKYYSGVSITLDNGRSSHDIQICQNVLNIAKESHDSVWYIEFIAAQGHNTTHVYSTYYGDKYCTGNLNCIRNLTVAKNNEFCTRIFSREARKDEYFGIQIWWK